MRRGVLKSDLIHSIGHEGTTLEVEYTDKTVFRYEDVPFSVFRKIVTAKSPGHAWLALREKFSFKKV